ncbi:lysine/ornithine N-monooxygenase [Pseudomonas hunanensis]|uniref:Lysine/ornithine N-monooxygenase n=1 Tax=Pseudomonas hunanensis TaxID=1247546 RepID=A0ACC6K7Y8_9PSED|nr:lysine/ornithine N-monooxygenase [Pseudomonas hunanensis]
MSAATLHDLIGVGFGPSNLALATPQLKAPVFLQGFCEATHGLSDTLLSVLPLRSEEIGEALYAVLDLSNSAHKALTKPLASVV